MDFGEKSVGFVFHGELSPLEERVDRGSTISESDARRGDEFSSLHSRIRSNDTSVQLIDEVLSNRWRKRSIDRSDDQRM